MNFEKRSDNTWEVGENSCILGYIVHEKTDSNDPDNPLTEDLTFFDMKAGINPSFELKELQEIVKFMESVR